LVSDAAGSAPASDDEPSRWAAWVAAHRDAQSVATAHLVAREREIEQQIQAAAAGLEQMPATATPADALLSRVLRDQAARAPAGEPLERCEARFDLLGRMQAMLAAFGEAERRRESRTASLRGRLADLMAAATAERRPAVLLDRIAGLLDHAIDENVERSPAQHEHQLAEADRLIDALDRDRRVRTARGASREARG
jgi:hypothetical protein